MKAVAAIAMSAQADPTSHLPMCNDFSLPEPLVSFARQISSLESNRFSGRKLDQHLVGHRTSVAID
jgi:hypothetical protein